MSTDPARAPEDRTLRDRLDDPFERAAERTARRWFKPGQSRNRLIRTSWKLIVFVVGATVVLGGLAMIVLPGPGFLVVIAGLAILASEFAWARSLLQEARKRAAKAGSKVKRLRRFRRRRVGGV